MNSDLITTLAEIRRRLRAIERWDTPALMTSFNPQRDYIQRLAREALKLFDGEDA